MVTCTNCKSAKTVPFANISVSDETTITKVIVKFTGKPCCDMEMKTYLSSIGELYIKNKMFQILYDASEVGIPSSAQLRQQSEFMRHHDDQSQKILRNVAIVVKSTIARQMLNGLFLLKTPACPLEVFSDMIQAKLYLKNV